MTKNITVNQRGFIVNLAQKYGVNDLKTTPSVPATESLMKEDHGSGEVDKTSYLSLVMAIMYVARFTKPEVLMPTSYLATKCSKPTTTDRGHLMRVLKYLVGTCDEGLVFKYGIPFNPRMWADASHHLYNDGHGQAGLVITNGSAIRSTKIRLATRSSTESELCALEEASTYVVWYRLLLEDLGVHMSEPMVTYQDNKSSIIIAIQGATFKRTKHLIGRQSYLRERIQCGDLQLKYCPTKDMLADLMIKPVTVAVLKRLKGLLSIDMAN